MPESRPARRLALPRRGTGGGFSFFGDVISELKKVVWPTRQTTVRLSMVVLVTSGALGLLLGAFDWAFTEIMRRFLVPPPPGL
jgi:preprotein translocase subunit SecE